MSYLIQDAYTCQKLWKDALEDDTDAETLLAIRERYRRARRMDATYRRIYNEQNRAFLADYDAARAARRAELEPLTKRALCDLLRQSRDTALTKGQLIEYELSKINVESDHSRVKRIWAAMSDAEREGIQP